MKKRLLLATILLCGALYAMRAATPESLDPLSFDTASEEAREYVIDSLAACVREANVAFLQCRRDPPDRPTTDPIPIGYEHLLGLWSSRCLQMVRGKPALERDSCCYFYDTPRRATGHPRLEDRFPSSGLKPGEFWYQDGWDTFPKIGRGRSLYWKLKPPYDPYFAGPMPVGYPYWARARFVVLAFVTPQREPLMHRVEKTPSFISGTNKVLQAVGGKDLATVAPRELMEKLRIEEAFASRVFRLNEGCVFLVDHPLGELERLYPREDGLMTCDPYGWEARTDRRYLIQLTREEVSELVYLAYAVNGEAAEYRAAQGKWGEFLDPVSAIRTTIGSRLQSMLRVSGLLLSGVLPDEVNP